MEYSTSMPIDIPMKKDVIPELNTDMAKALDLAQTYVDRLWDISETIRTMTKETLGRASFRGRYCNVLENHLQDIECILADMRIASRVRNVIQLN